MKTAVKLNYPVTVGSVTTAELHVRRPRVADTLAMEKRGGSDADKEVAMFASLCEVAPEFIAELDLLDYKQLQKVYESFLSSRQASAGASA